jgi:alpha-N-arabinofuranosidase
MSNPPPGRNSLVLRPNRGINTISPNLHGQFAEHLGHGIYEGLWVGPESDIPNTGGIRDDVFAALKRIRVPVLRWPGGCFADEYHWMDGIGPRDRRPTSINTHWGGVTETNHFGTHEFLEFCRRLGCEPYICGNVGSGTVREMQQWVEYITGDTQSPMTDLRRSNGRAEPWAVRFWGVGNENWGCGGNMRPEYYADQFRRYATYCRNFGSNKLYKIASGGTDTDFHWTEVLMREAGNLMDALSVHSYFLPGSWQAKGPAVGFGEEAWYAVLHRSLALDGILAGHSAVMDRFDPQRRVGLILDEWGTWYDPDPGTNPGFLRQQNTLRDALSAGIVLNILHSRCDRVRMANIAQMVNVLQAMILTRGREMTVTPTFHVFEMYLPHQDSVLVPMDLKAAGYAFGGRKIPAVSASASQNPDGSLCLSLCNLDPNREQDVRCSIQDASLSEWSGRVLTADRMDSYNDFERPDAVTPRPFDEVRPTADGWTIRLPAKSVTVLQFR